MPREPTHDNREIARTFDTLADLLEIEGANPFRVRAYRNAARWVEGLSQSVPALIRDGHPLHEYPGIGKDLAEKIRTVAETGRLPLLEEVERRLPEGLSELTHIDGLGPKRVQALYHQLDISNPDTLEAALASGRIRELRGFGVKTEQRISEGLKRLRARQGRVRLIDAERVGDGLVAALRGIQGVDDVCIAGSYRRRRETVGDLDILVSARGDSPVMARFIELPEVDEVLVRGTTRASVRLLSDLRVDLRLVPEASYGAALHYFTGSRAHNIAVRRLGMARGLKINEYGIFKGRRRVAGRREEEVFDAVDLPWIPPELRENRGEIEAAREGRLPNLIRMEQIRGNLHTHTDATDGRYSLEAMVQAARARGHEYLAITDHSQAVAVARGLDPARLRAQLRAIDALQGRFDDIRILKGIEVDILEDGRLDLPDDVLAELDLTVASVHSRFDLPARQQTERILRAMDNPHFRILGHPTGRLINKRAPYAVELERVMEGARERGRFLELNAQPDRLDLTDSACRLAKEMGVKLVISTDAHTPHDLDHLRFGIGQARRGWIEAEDVLNTLPLEELLTALA